MDKIKPSHPLFEINDEAIMVNNIATADVIIQRGNADQKREQLQIQDS
ncbi:MAG: hypothetical protein ACLU0O_07520 [Collinsella sp.]